MTEAVTTFLSEYVSKELAVFIISLLPILELRGGLIAAKLLGVPYVRAIIISIIGNVLPLPFVLFFIKRLFKFMVKHNILKKLVLKIQNIGETKAGSLMKKYPRRVSLGLFLFVAIPLPGTGGWTGALIASLLNLKVKKSAPIIMLGVLCAGLIMSIITYGIPALFSM